MGNRQIKTSNKTKKESVEGFSLRVISPPRACEPVLEMETDLADSGAQLMANYYILPSQRARPMTS